MAGQMGSLKVHALDQGEAPVLLSVQSLRGLGAVIDYEHDVYGVSKCRSMSGSVFGTVGSGASTDASDR